MAGESFVRAVMEHLDVSSPAELAEAMGWKRGTERLVAKWLKGNNQPSYGRTWEMLERCGWLTIGEAPAAKRSALQPGRPKAETAPAEESLSARMDDALENQARMWAELERIANAVRDIESFLRPLAEARSNPPQRRRSTG